MNIIQESISLIKVERNKVCDANNPFNICVRENRFVDTLLMKLSHLPSSACTELPF